MRNPSGLITATFSDTGAREGAYKFAENEEVCVGELSAAACRAAAVRARGMPYVFVPVDATSLGLRDYEGAIERGVGTVGCYERGGTGLLVMNAIAVSPLGVPLGLLDQQWWIRKQSKEPRRQKRKFEEKESRQWLATIAASCEHWAEANGGTRLWFQLDRGGDMRETLLWADMTQHWVTVRACYDRKTTDPDLPTMRKAVEESPVRGRIAVEVAATKQRRARTAPVEVRYVEVNLHLLDKRTKREDTVTLSVVLARESASPADGSEPLEWLLLTNRVVRSLADAETVLFGYTQRWRIEQFHKIWKSVCHVEETQLREAAHIERWATVLGSVAMRLLRLTYLSRTQPNIPASVELSQPEIAALIVNKGRKGIDKITDSISMATAVRWIAELGGYVGKSSGGPPGSLVLARGFNRLEPYAEGVAKALEFLNKEDQR